MNKNGEIITELEIINWFYYHKLIIAGHHGKTSRDCLLIPCFLRNFLFFFSLSPRKRYRKVLYYVVVIQKNYRAFSGRKKFLCLKKAAIILQKQRRGQLARRVYRERLEEKQRQEEERRKEEEERCSMLSYITLLSVPY